jgi:DNA invertase Pin-like site-specific DNA recombinase
VEVYEAMRIFSYIRVSGLGQVDKDGPIRQRKAIVDFCVKYTLTHAAEFFEGGVSGTIDGMDRPQFAEMLTKADTFNAGCFLSSLHIDGIVVECMDRLARDLMVSELLLRECRNRNIKVFCADQGELTDVASDSGDPTRTMFRQILGAIAQWNKSVTVNKLRGARVRARANGGRCEGRKPYGLIDPKEAEVKSIIKMLEGDKISYSHIAARLNLQGMKTRMGLPWSKETVYSVATARRQKHKLFIPTKGK